MSETGTFQPDPPPPLAEEVLRVENLSVAFDIGGRPARVVDEVSFSILRGETLGLVGESGCGKSVTSLALLGLVPSPPGRIEGGRVLFGGRDLAGETPEALRAVRGKEIAMIFQEPMTSLNPVFPVGEQVAEAVRAHEAVSAAEARRRAREALKAVGIPDPDMRLDQYPHELSGGMMQRAMIAMAIVNRPRLLIADEPTTALDVTVQAQILDLLRALQDEYGMAVLFITHDLGVVAELAHRVCVMYAGRIVEQAPTREFFAGALHPYSIALLRSLPQTVKPGETLQTIPGEVPSPGAMPAGCRFHPRCPRRMEICTHVVPPLEEKLAGHFCACHDVKRHRLLSRKKPDGPKRA